MPFKWDVRLGRVSIRDVANRSLVCNQPAVTGRSADYHRRSIHLHIRVFACKWNSRSAASILTGDARCTDRQLVSLCSPASGWHSLHLRQPRLHHLQLHHQHGDQDVPDHPWRAPQLPVRWIFGHASIVGFGELRCRGSPCLWGCSVRGIQNSGRESHMFADLWSNVGLGS